jgi:hypothetical protein
MLLCLCVHFCVLLENSPLSICLKIPAHLQAPAQTCSLSLSGKTPLSQSVILPLWALKLCASLLCNCPPAPALRGGTTPFCLPISSTGHDAYQSLNKYLVKFFTVMDRASCLWNFKTCRQLGSNCEPSGPTPSAGKQVKGQAC